MDRFLIIFPVGTETSDNISVSKSTLWFCAGQIALR